MSCFSQLAARIASCLWAKLGIAARSLCHPIGGEEQERAQSSTSNQLIASPAFETVRPIDAARQAKGRLWKLAPGEPHMIFERSISGEPHNQEGKSIDFLPRHSSLLFA